MIFWFLCGWRDKVIFVVIYNEFFLILKMRVVNKFGLDIIII